MFVVLSLPRSRSAWLSRFLTYGNHVCGHDELRHARSMGDVEAWCSQPDIGSAETAAAPWWRLLGKYASKIVVVRRPVEDVVDSLLALPVPFEPARLVESMCRLNCKLDQIEARLDCLSVDYADLANEETCQRVFEYCLPYRHDHDHWAALESVNVQCDMRAMMRYCEANRASLEKLSKIAKHQTLAMMARKPVADLDGITFQSEPFETWVSDAQKIFDDHLVLVGEAPGDWANKNLPLMRRLYDAGAMQIITARCNGRMFGYLMTLIAPSLEMSGKVSAANTTFYADPSFPGLGMKLQKAAIHAMRERGVDEVVMQAGVRGSGEKIGAIYRRLGAANDGQSYRLQLTGA